MSLGVGRRRSCAPRAPVLESISVTVSSKRFATHTRTRAQRHRRSARCRPGCAPDDPVPSRGRSTAGRRVPLHATHSDPRAERDRGRIEVDLDRLPGRRRWHGRPGTPCRRTVRDPHDPRAARQPAGPGSRPGPGRRAGRCRCSIAPAEFASIVSRACAEPERPSASTSDPDRRREQRGRGHAVASSGDAQGATARSARRRWRRRRSPRDPHGRSSSSAGSCVRIARSSSRSSRPGSTPACSTSSARPSR